MLLEILPTSLYDSPNIEVILKKNGSSINYKSLSESLVNKKMYLSSVAILLVMNGEQVIKDYEGADLVVKENEMVLLPKDLYVVSDFVINNKSFEAYVFFIDDLLIKKFLLLNTTNFNKNKSIARTQKTKTTPQVIKYVHSLREIYKNTVNNKALLEIKVLEFLLLLELQDSSKLLISSLISPIKKRSIKEFMEDNFLENLKVNDYATLTGRSISTFNREFKRLYGTTPKKWLIKEKLKKSHELLTSTNLNVTQVSMEVGYENVSHFITAYKKTYGVTPKSSSNIK